MALRAHIRVFLINPRNTSALAYDGSGKVTRDMSDFSKCTFQTGKRYDCDLSASYNIAARYFLRAMEKSMSSEAWTRGQKSPNWGREPRVRCLHFGNLRKFRRFSGYGERAG